MRRTFAMLLAQRDTGRRRAAMGAGLLGLGLLTGCPPARPPEAAKPEAAKLGPSYEVMRLPSDTLYTGYLHATIPSAGTYAVNRRVPDLLLTVYYRQNPKTGDLVRGYTKFLVQTNGRVTANLLLPDSALTTTTTHRVCSFQLKVDFEFGRNIAAPYEVSILETPALEATQAGRDRQPTKARQPPPDERTVVRGRIVGLLNLRTKTLEATAETNEPAAPPVVIKLGITHFKPQRWPCPEGGILVVI